MGVKGAVTLQKGDIILAQGGKWDKWARNFAYQHYGLEITWTHAACYAGHILSAKCNRNHQRWLLRRYIPSMWEKHTTKLLYLRVNVGNDIKSQAVQFMARKTWKIGRIHGYDLWSLWHNAKQIEGPQGTPGWKYYCSEIVWAGYRSQWINLDPDGDATIVWPDDLLKSPLTSVIGYWENP